MEIKISS